VWLWQSGHVWIWAIAAGFLGLLTWPLSRFVRDRANNEARLALGGLAEPSRGGNAVEQEAWTKVLAIADATAPFAFTEIDPLVATARDVIEVVARCFHPQAHSAWAQFSLPELAIGRTALPGCSPRGTAPHPRREADQAQSPLMGAPTK
jgi:uncharacterized protein